MRSTPPANLPILCFALLLSVVAPPLASQTPSTRAAGQAPASTSGDPDRPVVTGRVPNPPSAAPVEVLRQTVVRGRLVLVDLRGGRHLVPDGTYAGLRKDGTIVIRGKKISVESSKDVTLKGSKINENSPPAPPGGANEIALDDASGSELLSRLPDDTYRSAAGASLTLHGGRIVSLQGF